MAFFNDLGKKFVQVGQATAQKTKELGDIAKLNSLISEEEKRISNSIFKIGELYLELHYTDYAKEFAELVNSIKNSQQTISEAKQQLQILRGVNRCERCGAEVSNSMAFCSTCGSKINIASNHNRCSVCGTLVAKEMKFCTSCGTPMLLATEPTTSNGSTTTEKLSKFKICSSCGEKMSCEEMFCTECGNKL